MASKFSTSKHVFQMAALIWLFYLVCLVIVDAFLYPSAPFFSPILYYHLANGIPALVFLGISYTPWLEKWPRPLVPALILLITATPILVNYSFNLPEAPLSNLEGMILRQMPVLFIGLVLVAWHFDRWTMIAYSLVANLVEFGIVCFFGLINGERLTAFSFIILIRTVSFIGVGMFINLLIVRLRLQQESLIAANTRLTHYTQTLENLTVSRERNRMSRELHDTVVHTLSGLSVQLETARAYWEVQPETSRKLLDQSLEITRSGLQETRRAIKALRASPLDDLGLARAIQTLAETAQERGQLVVEASFPEIDPVLPPDVEQAIYRITQEAVENVVQHAGAHHLSIRLVQEKKGLVLLVQDDGSGFDMQVGQPAGHFGIAGMKERAQLAGGSLAILSRPNEGTIVRLFIDGSGQ